MDPNWINKSFENARKLKLLNQQAPVLRPHRDPVTENGTSKTTDNILVTTIPGDSHFCKTPFDNLKPICLNEMQVPKVHEGRYLTCKVVGKPQAKINVNALVQDLNGDLEKLIIHNYSYNIADTAWIPTDTILVIKEPYLCYGSGQKVMLRVDSPSDLIFVDPTDLDFLKKVGAEKWHQISEMDPEKIKEKGNDLFKAKDYEAATFLYNRAIRYAPDMPVLYLNKASSQLRSGYFDGAYESAKTALDKGGDREKALFRMGLAAYGLRDWKLALDHFKTVCKEFPENKDAKVELNKAKQRLAESQTGNYDWKSICSTIKRGGYEFDVADYVGPIEIADTPGKGKGIVAKEDIPKGTLLLVSKPFAAAYADNFSNKLFAVNMIAQELETAAGKLQMIRSIEQVRKNPSKTKELYKLYAGDLPRDEKIPDGVIDTARIEQICTYNRFGIKSKSLETQDKLAFGLYLIASYFNHDCFGSAIHNFLGEIMLVYATRDHKKGEEITVPYFSPLDPFMDHSKTATKKWGFTCHCQLCEANAEDVNFPKQIQLFKKFENSDEVYQLSPENFIARAKPVLKEMRKLYQNRSGVKIYLNRLLFFMGLQHYETGRLEEAIGYLEEIVSSVDEKLKLAMDIPNSLLLLAACYERKKKKEKAIKLVQEAYDMSLSTCLDQFMMSYPEGTNFQSFIDWLRSAKIF